MLKKVISGGQSGADIAGVTVAKKFSLETGGFMPLGFKTLDGNRPEYADKFGMVETPSADYSIRTGKNVESSDGTIRLAGDFLSKGEICTAKWLLKYNKPFFNVDLTKPNSVQSFVEWIKKYNIQTLNVAGNAEQTFSGTFKKSVEFLTNAFLEMGLGISVDKSAIIFSGLNLSHDVSYSMFDFNGNEIQGVIVKKKVEQ